MLFPAIFFLFCSTRADDNFVIWKYGAHPPANIDALKVARQFIAYLWSCTADSKAHKLVDLVQKDFKFLTCEGKIMKRKRFIKKILLNLDKHGMRYYNNITNAFAMSESYLGKANGFMPIVDTSSPKILYGEVKAGIAYPLLKFDLMAQNKEVTFIVTSRENRYQLYAGYMHRCTSQKEPEMKVQAPVQVAPKPPKRRVYVTDPLEAFLERGKSPALPNDADLPEIREVPFTMEGTNLVKWS